MADLKSEKINTTLDPRLATAFRMYCRQMQIKPADLVKDAVKEYLFKRGIRWE